MSQVHKPQGFIATLPVKVQIENTLDIMNKLAGGNDVRNWSVSARKELLRGPKITIVNSDNDVLCEAPLLALVVASTTFRQHLQVYPDSKRVKVDADGISVRILVDWIKRTLNSAGKFGVQIPKENHDLIILRNTAQKLGMDMYVAHFLKAYKNTLYTRTPTMAECRLLQNSTVDANDELLLAVGERLAYLRRRKAFSSVQLTALNNFLNTNSKICSAVEAADARVREIRKN